MAAGKGRNPEDVADTRWILGVVVIVACGIAGGLWGGLMYNSSNGAVEPVNSAGVLAGLFLGVALFFTAWIASTRS